MKKLATGRQLWRLNQLGRLQTVDPIPGRSRAKSERRLRLTAAEAWDMLDRLKDEFVEGDGESAEVHT